MKTWKKLAIGLVLVILLTPLGRLAKGTAWGEWILAPWWHARLAGYNLTGYGGAVGYLLSAVIGAGLIGGVAWILGRLLSKGDRDAS